MDCVHGNILLVGDGDFSFTVAYATKLKDKTDVTIHTSTLLSKNELFKIHKNAEINVASLKELGVHVLYKVDATRLSRCVALDGQSYDVIIFNFPHTGGKSNIKKNRQLLKDFFHSANETLHPHAQVIVTLCRGQAGTPRDQPVREWHDSWQVVAQAAYSGWVAYRIEPFSIEHYPQYGSTGFRSLDRNFYTKDSFSHFFRRAAECYPQTYGMEAVNGASLPNAVVKKLRVKEKVLVEHHPTRLASRQLHTLLAEAFQSPGHSGMVIRDFMFNEPELVSAFTSKNETQPQNTEKEESDNIRETGEEQSQNKVASQIGCTSITQIGCSVESDVYIDESTAECTNDNHTVTQPDRLNGWNSKYAVYPEERTDAVAKGNNAESLVTSLLESKILARDCVGVVTKGHVYAAQGQVFRRSFIDTAKVPHAIAHELVILCPIHKKEPEDKSQIFRSSVETCLQHLLPNTGSVIQAKIQVNELPDYCTDHLHDPHSYTYSHCSSTLFSTAACNQVKAQGKPDPKQAETLRQKQLVRVVGFVGILKDSWLQFAGLDQHNETMSLMCAIFDLDNLALARYDIPDHRLLWSENPDFLDQFTHISPAETAIFQPLSHHPPLWRHDLSFWEQRGVNVDETRLMDTIADIAGDTVNRVLLVNAWVDPDTGLTSKCYRIVYQSLDRPLSHSCAHDIQNAIRLKVAEVLGVTLR